MKHAVRAHVGDGGAIYCPRCVPDDAVDKTVFCDAAQCTGCGRRAFATRRPPGAGSLHWYHARNLEVMEDAVNEL